MDSFYDVPRCAPNPTLVERLEIGPLVPEVSLLSPYEVRARQLNAYNNPRNTQTNQVLNTNRESKNVNRPNSFSEQNSSQLLRKQVRFEGPTLQQRPSLSYEPFVARQYNLDNDAEPCGRKNLDETKNLLKSKEPHYEKTFEEMYMANIPNRHLDLSILELPKITTNATEKCVSNLHDLEHSSQELNKITENKENELPKTYREFLETQKKVIRAAVENQKNDSVTDIFNYKNDKVFNATKISGKNIAQSHINDCHTNKGSDLSFSTQRGTACDKYATKFVWEQEVDKPSQSEKLQYDSKFIPKVNRPLENKQLYYSSKQNTPEFYKSSDSSQIHTTRNSPSKYDTLTKTTDICCQHKAKEKDEFEPTNRDLLKIIAQQNEQLLLLQKQVALLLNREQNTVKSIEPAQPEQNEIDEGHLKNSCFRNVIPDTPRKKGLSKFSVDVMTSFEVAIRPQHNRQNIINCKPKIREIPEVDSVTCSDRNEKTESLLLQEPLIIPERCPSPEPSININMNDYDSSDDEVSASEIGATFYHNLMGQVNNILRKAHIQTTEDLAFRDKEKETEVEANIGNTNKTMNKVREATIKHLKNIGVTINDIENEDIVSVQNQTEDYSPTEISFAVKQLLMKYLPNDHLAKISSKKQSTTKSNEISPPITNVRPELSFASVQYMKKYNLIPKAETTPKLDKFKKNTANRILNKQIDNPKILDMTALKMQPKLL